MFWVVALVYDNPVYRDFVSCRRINDISADVKRAFQRKEWMAVAIGVLTVLLARADFYADWVKDQRVKESACDSDSCRYRCV